ncbi:uncharacterized protein LOC135171481 [Diachasmimorpha longicaudata]|uniref:uncharacterized protein LOC135171481 n=1 Tax=Diachasmimorpha longicaudata TaxID=58733 RepID=UPI0030B90323
MLIRGKGSARRCTPIQPLQLQLHPAIGSQRMRIDAHNVAPTYNPPSAIYFSIDLATARKVRSEVKRTRWVCKISDGVTTSIRNPSSSRLDLPDIRQSAHLQLSRCPGAPRFVIQDSPS